MCYKSDGTAAGSTCGSTRNQACTTQAACLAASPPTGGSLGPNVWSTHAPNYGVVPAHCATNKGMSYVGHGFKSCEDLCSAANKASTSCSKGYCADPKHGVDACSWVEEVKKAAVVGGSVYDVSGCISIAGVAFNPSGGSCEQFCNKDYLDASYCTETYCLDTKHSVDGKAPACEWKDPPAAVKSCAKDQYVNRKVCTACPSGRVRVAGDKESGDDTTCTAKPAFVATCGEITNGGGAFADASCDSTGAARVYDATKSAATTPNDANCCKAKSADKAAADKAAVDKAAAATKAATDKAAADKAAADKTAAVVDKLDSAARLGGGAVTSLAISVAMVCFGLLY